MCFSNWGGVRGVLGLFGGVLGGCASKVEGVLGGCWGGVDKSLVGSFHIASKKPRDTPPQTPPQQLFAGGVFSVSRGGVHPPNGGVV